VREIFDLHQICPPIFASMRWLEYDFVAVVVLFVGIGFLALIVLGI